MGDRREGLVSMVVGGGEQREGWSFSYSIAFLEKNLEASAWKQYPRLQSARS